MANFEGIPEPAQKVMEAWEYSKSEFRTARTKSQESYRYINNDQWDDAVKAEAQKNKKPVLTYNVLMPTVLIMIGNEQLAKRQGRIRPRRMTEPHRSAIEIARQRWNAVVDRENLEEKIQTAFFDALTTRMGGWIERSFAVNDEGYLEYRYDVAENMLIHPDPELKVNDWELSKCRWLITEAWRSLDWVKSEFDLDTELVEREEKQPWWQKLYDSVRKFANSDYDYTKSPYFDKRNDRFMVLEMQERRFRKMTTVWDPDTGEYFLMEPSDYQQVRQNNPRLERMKDTTREHIHLTTVLPYFDYAVARDEPARDPIPNFNLMPLYSFAKTNLKAVEAVSMIDLLKDAQDDFNKHKSQTRDFLTQHLSANTFIHHHEKEAIEKLQKEGNQPSGPIPLKNPQNQPFRMAPESLNPQLFVNVQDSMQFFDRISMTNQAMRGEMGKSGESGKLFSQKVDRALAAINPYFEAVAQLRKYLLKDYIQHFGWVYSERDRMLEVKNDRGEVDQVLVNLAYSSEVFNDVSEMEAYVELDEGENNRTVKEENFEKLLALTNIIAQIRPELVDVETLLEKAPVEGAQDMVEYVRQVLQGINQAQGQQQQLQMAREILEQAEKETQMENESARTAAEVQEKVARAQQAVQQGQQAGNGQAPPDEGA